MNKKTLLKIAKTIYLQDIVSKQIYAALFNPNSFFDNKLGDFRAAERLQSVYAAFIGQKQRLDKNGSVPIQFLQKNGLNIKIFKFLWGDYHKCSQQVMAVMPLNKAAMYLTSIQSFIDSKAGQNGIKQVFSRFVNKYTQYIDEMKKTKNGSSVKDQKKAAVSFVNQLNDQINSFYGMASRLFKVISQQNNTLINNVNNIKQSLQRFKNQIQTKQNFTIQDLYDMEQFTGYYEIGDYVDQINAVLADDFMIKIVDSLTTHASRMNMLNKMYDYAKDYAENAQNQQDKQIALYAKQAIQTCNTTKQLNRFDLTKRQFLDKNGKQRTVSQYNLQDRFNIVDRQYIENKQNPYQQQSRVRYVKNSFISFVSGFSKRIKKDVFEQGITNYLLNQFGQNELNEMQREQLQQLRDIQQSIVQDSKNKDNFDYVIKSTDGWLYYQDFVEYEPELMKQIKQTVEYF